MKEIINMQMEINEIEKTIEKNETKIFFFEKIKTFDKPLASITKKKKENT